MSRRFLRKCCGWIVGVSLVTCFCNVPVYVGLGFAFASVALWAWLDGRVKE